jgi:sodium-dependent dicarboxylate transporter 2/3/5
MESRFDAKRLFKDAKWKPLGKVQLFIINFLIALSTALFLKAEGMTEAMQNTIFVLTFAIGLWLTEAIPPYVVGIMTIISLVWLLGSDIFIENPINTATYTETWASPIIFLMLGGFFLAEGLKTNKVR